MKIRTITAGVSLSPADVSSDAALREQLQPAADFLTTAQARLEANDYEVQTTRIVTNPFEEYCTDAASLLSVAERLDRVLGDLGVGLCGLGALTRAAYITQVPALLEATTRLSCTARLGSSVDVAGAEGVARAVLSVSRAGANGERNFRFGLVACEVPTPFFPMGFCVRGQAGFSVGLECGDLLVRAWGDGGRLEDAEDSLRKVLHQAYAPLDALCVEMEQELGVAYHGMDTSMVPSVVEADSVVEGYRALGCEFGGAGTLAVSALITRALQTVDVRRCGYQGLMLPVCEDAGLAAAASKGAYSVHELLLQSAVCSVGLDCVPLPGDVSVEQLAKLFLDVTALAIKWDKPLAARVFPVPGKTHGDWVEFDSPYLVHCKVMELS